MSTLCPPQKRDGGQTEGSGRHQDGRLAEMLDFMEHMALDQQRNLGQNKRAVKLNKMKVGRGAGLDKSLNF